MQRSQKEVRLPSRVYLATLLTIFFAKHLSAGIALSAAENRQAFRRNSDTPAEWTKSAATKPFLESTRVGMLSRVENPRAAGHQWQGQARPWPRSARPDRSAQLRRRRPRRSSEAPPCPGHPRQIPERPGLAKQRSDDGSIDRPQRIDRRTLGVQLGPQTAGETQVTPLSSQG